MFNSVTGGMKSNTDGSAHLADEGGGDCIVSIASSNIRQEEMSNTSYLRSSALCSYIF